MLLPPGVVPLTIGKPTTEIEIGLEIPVHPFTSVPVTPKVYSPTLESVGV